MYKAVGFISGRVYATGASKRECYRALDVKYREVSSKKFFGSGNYQTIVRVYPEPLVIVRG